MTRTWLLSTLILTTALGAPAAARAEAVPAYVQQRVPDAQSVGRGTMTYLVWDIYDAILYAPQGRQSYDAPFALELDYKHASPKKRIIDVTIDQMTGQGFTDQDKLHEWRAAMNRVFSAAQAGSILTGIYQPQGPTCFFKDSAPTGCIDDPAFGRPFFDIWLSPKTTEPDLRHQLLGTPS